MIVKLGKLLGTDIDVYHDTCTAPNSHMLAFGSSGGGKTVTMQGIITDIVHQGGTVIVPSWHKSLTDDQIFPPFKSAFAKYRNDILVHRDGLALNLFEKIKYSDGEVESEYDTAEAAGSIICNALKIKESLRIVVKRACQRVVRENTYPEDGIRAIDEALKTVDIKGSREAREKMCLVTDRNLFHDGCDIKHNAINIVQLSRLDSETQSFVVEVLLQYMWRLGNADVFKDDPVYIFLDECQNAMHTEHSGLSTLISEGRKMNIHLLLATQLILQGTTNTVQQRLAQAGLTMYFKPVSNRIALTAKMISASNPDEWADKLTDLQKGQFIATGCFQVGGRRLNYPVIVDGYIDENEKWDECEETQCFESDETLKMSLL